MAAINLVPQVAQWNCYQNQANVMAITIKNRSTGAVVNITSRTYRLDIFSKDGTAILSTADSPATLTLTNGGATGVLTITMSQAISLAATWTDARYDLVETISSVPYARIAGQVTMTRRGVPHER